MEKIPRISLKLISLKINWAVEITKTKKINSDWFTLSLVELIPHK